MTPERRAEVEAWLDDLIGPEPPPPKPKVVANDGRVIRDADVVVSPDDVNARKRGGITEVSVRRPDPWQKQMAREAAEAAREREGWRPLGPGEVRVNLAEAQRQWEVNQQMREWDRRQRRLNDPCNLGLYGVFGNEEDY